MSKWSAYDATKTSHNVHTQLLSNHELLVESNKKYIKTLIDITIFLASQGLAYRGHNESQTSLNQGIFKYKV